MTEESGFDSRQGKGIILFSNASRPIMGPTQPQIQGVPEGKQPRREADNSAPSSAEPKNECSCNRFPYKSINAFTACTAIHLPIAYM